MPTAGRNASLYLWDSTGASRSFTVYVGSIGFDYTSGEANVTTFGDAQTVHIPTIKDVSISLAGQWDSTVDGYMAGMLSACTRYAFGPAGSAPTSLVKYTGSAICTAYSLALAPDAAVTWTGTVLGRGATSRTTWA